MTEGLAALYILDENSKNGEMPRYALVKVCDDYYAEQRVGVTRLYAALGANQRIDKLVRIYNETEMPETTDSAGVLRQAEYIILEDGRQYRISAIQKAIGEDAFDLTLERLGDNYDIAG